MNRKFDPKMDSFLLIRNVSYGSWLGRFMLFNFFFFKLMTVLVLKSEEITT